MSPILIVAIIAIAIVAFIIYFRQQGPGITPSSNKKVRVSTKAINPTPGQKPPSNYYICRATLTALDYSVDLTNYEVSNNFAADPGSTTSGTVHIVNSTSGNPNGIYDINIPLPYVHPGDQVHTINFLHVYAGGPPYKQETEQLQDPRP